MGLSCFISGCLLSMSHGMWHTVGVHSEEGRKEGKQQSRKEAGRHNLLQGRWNKSAVLTWILWKGIKESFKAEVPFYLSLQAWVEFKHSHWGSMGHGIKYVSVSLEHKVSEGWCESWGWKGVAGMSDQAIWQWGAPGGLGLEMRHTWMCALEIQVW